MLQGAHTNVLPAGYTRAEFLESTGTQYIDTGLVGAGTDSYVDFRGESFSATKRAFQVSGWGLTTPKKDGDMYAIVPKKNAINYFTGYIKGISLGQLNTTIKLGSLTINGKTYTQDGFGNIENSNGTINESYTLKLGAFPDGVSYVDSWWIGKCHSFKAKLRNGAVEFAPVIDPTGEPCMFDRVSKQPFRNAGSGQFIAGLTLQQAAQLGRKLPSTGGTLTVSLPEGYEQSERIVESLTQAESKGWVLTIQTYAAETAAATYSLRRVWVRRQQAEHGRYVDADGTRWQVEWCVGVIGADPESLGYERFRSVEVAAEYWGLTEYVYPETETIES